MLTVYDYLQLRTAHAQSESIRSLAKRLHHAQKALRKVIRSATGEPEPYTRDGPVICPKLRAFIFFIEQVLRDDQTEPMKHRQTASEHAELGITPPLHAGVFGGSGFGGVGGLA